ncbi:hypothetical protein [Halarchaeum salinum]
MAEGDYSGFVERLRRDYDPPPGEFYNEVGLPPNADDKWGSTTNRPLLDETAKPDEIARVQDTFWCTRHRVEEGCLERSTPPR